MDGTRRGRGAGALLAGALIGMVGIGPAAADPDALLDALPSVLLDGPGRTEPMLRVEWQAVPARPGHARLAGAVHNDYGRAARDVQLRVSELDAGGQVVATVDGPTLPRVPGQGQARFDVAVPDSGHRYRVAVAAFSLDFGAGAVR